MSLRTTQILLTLTLIATLAAISVAVYVISSTTGYDEDAHRAAVTEVHPNVDWPAYRAAVEDVCDDPDTQLVLVAALQADAGKLSELKSDLSFMCPDRLRAIAEAGL